MTYEITDTIREAANEDKALPVYGSATREVIGHMTKKQARRYGDRNMPSGLKLAGFQTVIFQSDSVIHGGDYLRINYGK